MRSAIPVEDEARVSEARRVAQAIASELKLSEQMHSDVGIVANEIATNVLKHGRKGEVHIYPCLQPGCSGVDIFSIDRGPGMSDTDACLRDGFSSAGTAGTGLGAIRRLSQEFDIY